MGDVRPGPRKEDTCALTKLTCFTTHNNCDLDAFGHLHLFAVFFSIFQSLGGFIKLKEEIGIGGLQSEVIRWLVKSMLSMDSLKSGNIT